MKKKYHDYNFVDIWKFFYEGSKVYNICAVKNYVAKSINRLLYGTEIKYMLI